MNYIYVMQRDIIPGSLPEIGGSYQEWFFAQVALKPIKGPVYFKCIRNASVLKEDQVFLGQRL